MSSERAPGADQAGVLLAMYDDALPEVFGYLAARCPTTALAEDLTAETFLAAVAAVQADRVPRLSVAWLITVARNKLVDHWRRREREARSLRLADSHLLQNRGVSNEGLFRKGAAVRDFERDCPTRQTGYKNPLDFPIAEHHQYPETSVLPLQGFWQIAASLSVHRGIHPQMAHIVHNTDQLSLPIRLAARVRDQSTDHSSSRCRPFA
jgi:hypothetical protein